MGLEAMTVPTGVRPNLYFRWWASMGAGKQVSIGGGDRRPQGHPWGGAIPLYPSVLLEIIEPPSINCSLETSRGELLPASVDPVSDRKGKSALIASPYYSLPRTQSFATLSLRHLGTRLLFPFPGALQWVVFKGSPCWPVGHTKPPPNPDCLTAECSLETGPLPATAQRGKLVPRCANQGVVCEDGKLAHGARREVAGVK